MTKTRNLSDLLDNNGDVKLANLDNVPASNDASALTTGTLPIARIADGDITLAKLSATGTKDATTFLRGDNTFASAGGTNTPAFSASLGTNQNISSDTMTLVAFDTEEFDTDSAYTNTAGNYKFTVPSGKDGKYLLNASLRINNAIVDRFILLIKKNNSETFLFENGTKSYTSVSGSVVLDLAVADYIQIFVYQNLGTTAAIRTDGCKFQMFKLI